MSNFKKKENQPTNCIRFYRGKKINGVFIKDDWYEVRADLYDKKSGLSATEVSILQTILFNEYDWEYKPKDIAKYHGHTVNNITKTVSKIIEAGYGKRTVRNSTGNKPCYNYSFADYPKFLNKKEVEQPIEKQEEQIPAQIDYSNALENEIVKYIDEQNKYPSEDKIDTQNAVLNYIETTRKNIEHLEREGLIDEKFKEEQKINLTVLEHFCIERLERLYNLNLQL